MDSQLAVALRELLFTVKRYYRPEWGEHWREHFAVDRVNGILGHELKFDNQKLVNYYLRVGFDRDGSWRFINCVPIFIPRTKYKSRTTLPLRSCCREKASATSILSTPIRVLSS